MRCRAAVAALVLALAFGGCITDSGGDKDGATVTVATPVIVGVWVSVYDASQKAVFRADGTYAFYGLLGSTEGEYEWDAAMGVLGCSPWEGKPATYRAVVSGAYMELSVATPASAGTVRVRYFDMVRYAR